MNGTPRTLLFRAAGFVAAFAALQFSWQRCADTPAARAFISFCVVRPAALAISALTPTTPVQVSGTQLRTPGGGVNIINGCDGMELLLLLIAGFMVAPISGRARLLGAVAGLPMVFGLNLARVLALFYAHQYSMACFDLMHGLVTPIATVLSIAAYYHVCLHRAGRHHELHSP